MTVVNNEETEMDREKKMLRDAGEDGCLQAKEKGCNTSLTGPSEKPVLLTPEIQTRSLKKSEIISSHC